MKILWVVHPEPDYGEAMLYDGLRRALGNDNIVDFPYKYTYHGDVEKAQNKNVIKYVEAQDTSVNFSGINPKDYLREAGRNAFPFEWMAPRKGTDYDYVDILRMCDVKHFDLIVLAHPRQISIWFLEQLFKDMGNICQKTPIVMCDFEDYHEIRHDILQKFSIKLSFKASYVQNEPGIYGLPLCSPIVDNPRFRFDDGNKTIDVVARWASHHPLRQKVTNELLQIQDIASVVEIDKSLPYVEYLKEIASSRIGVSMGGFCNLHRTANSHWEIPTYKTMLLCEDQNIIHPYPFESGKHCVFFDPNIDGDATKKIKYYIKHDNEREMIADAGHEHLKQYHTTTARARYFLDMCIKHYPQLKGK